MHQTVSDQEQSGLEFNKEIPSDKAGLSRSKLIVLGIAVALILAGLSGAYFLGKNSTNNQIPSSIQTPTPTPNPTTDWETYSNSKYNISFKYPSNFSVNVSNDVEAQFLLSIIGNSEEYALDISPKIDKYSGMPYGKYPLNTQPNGSEKIGNYTWETIPSTTFCDMGMCGDTSPMYQVSSENYRYDFLLNNPKTPTQTFKSILSTFKFTDFNENANSSIEIPTPTIDEMSNWKSYNDVNYPFSIKYPKDWNLRTTYGKSVNNVNNGRVSGIDISSNLTYGSTIVVNIIDPQGKNLNEYIQTVNFSAPQQPNYTYKNNPAYRFTYSQNEREDGINIYYAYKGKIIFLAWNVYEYDLETANKIFDSLEFN